MANNYTTSTDCFSDISEGGYLSSTDATLTAVMNGFIAAASRMIDNALGMPDGFFSPSTADVTRYYDGSGEEHQDIGAWVSITSVSVSEQGGTASTDYTAWGSTDYITWPYTGTIKKLMIDPNGSKGGWYAYQRAVKVVGVQGYGATVPDTIALATRIQATRWFMRAKQAYQDTSANANVGEATWKQELDPDVKVLLWPYMLEFA